MAHTLSFAEILDSSASAVTLLAPTDAGVQKALSSLGITIESLLADPSRITDILLYHVLPSQIQVWHFKLRVPDEVSLEAMWDLQAHSKAEYGGQQATDVYDLSLWRNHLQAVGCSSAWWGNIYCLAVHYKLSWVLNARYSYIKYCKSMQSKCIKGSTLKFNSTQASDLVSGYSFNTQLTQGGIAQSVTIQGSGATSTFVGKSSSAPGLGSINTACNVSFHRPLHCSWFCSPHWRLTLLRWVYGTKDSVQFIRNLYDMTNDCGESSAQIYGWRLTTAMLCRSMSSQLTAFWFLELLTEHKWHPNKIPRRICLLLWAAFMLSALFSHFYCDPPPPARALTPSSFVYFMLCMSRNSAQESTNRTGNYHQ